MNGNNNEDYRASPIFRMGYVILSLIGYLIYNPF